MDDNKKNNDTEKRLEKLKEAYTKRLTSEFKRLHAINDKLLSGNDDHETLEALHAGLHTIAGAAGTFGFPSLGEAARHFERQVANRLSQAEQQASLPNDWIKALESAHNKDSLSANQSTTTIQQPVMEGAPVIGLVERDSILAKYAQSQFARFGFQVHWVKDANELNQLTSHALDLMLVDHHAIQNDTPDTNLADLWKIKLRDFKCPIFFIGAEESYKARLQALRAGGSGYYTKPLDMATLASKFAYMLAHNDAEPGRVMIIDQDASLVSQCQSVLENANMSIEVVPNPEHIFECISEFNPEVIIIGVWLSEVTGAELATLLAQTEHWAHLPIIFLSRDPNADLRRQSLLIDGDAVLEVPVDKELLVSLCQRRVQRLRAFNRTQHQDSLTGLLKHASIKDALQKQWQLAQRRLQVFSVVMLDIDHFKSVNDTYGHAIGDQVIAAIGTLIRQHFRNTDKLGRYGGEEFALVLPDCDMHQAEKLVNQLREDFAAVKFKANDTPFSCTLSAGIADNQRFPAETGESLLALADQALYRAKHDGRNCVVQAVITS
ncbi:diguanylate cyclase [Salinivibrio kushneri]|uniref:diguanylate cyclase n=1 Tax=Salinivibrio kushneri TaxID=1908198 RepID=A0AA47KIV6_9GAMM|nr:diguanylate cyclase [Salinivibrio kushneri]WBA07663.1 diguanylate cyclase [Salinivibrio kushneri]WBA10679.1 diguanylate cyclase [Salinivibrio kushneri]